MVDANFATWTIWFNLFEVRVINEVKCHTKVKVILRSNCKCLTFYRKLGVDLRLKGILVFFKVIAKLCKIITQQ